MCNCDKDSDVEIMLDCTGCGNDIDYCTCPSGFTDYFFRNKRSQPIRTPMPEPMCKGCCKYEPRCNCPTNLWEFLLTSFGIKYKKK